MKRLNAYRLMAACGLISGGLILGCETNEYRTEPPGPNPGDGGVRTYGQTGQDPQIVPTNDPPLTAEQRQTVERVPSGAGRPGATVHGGTGQGASVPAGVGQTGSTTVDAESADDDFGEARPAGAGAPMEDGTSGGVVVPGGFRDGDGDVYWNDDLRRRFDSAQTDQERQDILREARQLEQERQRNERIQQGVDGPGDVGNPADPQGTGQAGDPGAPGSPTPSGQTGTPGVPADPGGPGNTGDTGDVGSPQPGGTGTGNVGTPQQPN